MNGKCMGVVFLAAWLTAVGAAFAEQVEVIADSAVVKVGDEVIGTVKRGERFELLRREGPWLAISLQTPEGEREGWIFVKRVQEVIESGIDQESTAPGPFELIRADVRLTQFSQGRPTKLFFELTLANQGTKAVPYDASNLILEVDDQAIKIAPTGRQQSSWIFKKGAMNGRVHSSQLKYLAAGEIAPGGTVSGWVNFEVPQIEQPGDAASKRWILSGNIGGTEMQLDLGQRELEALGVKVRPSSIDPSIQVLEIGPRVNGLNVEKLIEARKALEAKRETYIVMLTSGNCVVGELGYRQLSSMRTQQPVHQFFVNFPRELRHRMRFHYGHYEAETEPAAAVQIVGKRPSSGGQLIKYLTDASPRTRAATARAMARHYGESGVVEALLLTVDDKDPGVRTAVVQSLASSLSRSQQRPEQSPSQVAAQVLEAILKATDDADATVRSAASGVLARSNDPQATEAVLKTMADKEPTVRTSAARSAGSHPATSVAEPLLNLLDDPDWKVIVAAATSLGKLKSEPAVPRLQELESGESKPVAAAAIDALRAIGIHSDLEAAIRKIDVGRLSRDEFTVLAQSKEKRVVEKLIGAMQSRQVRQDMGSLARTLGQIGDTDAVEPLINQMVYNNVRNEELARALGKLGDKRAIEPLEKSLAKASGSSSYHRALQEALLMLDAPGVLDKLVADLKEIQNPYEAQKVLEVLGRAGGDRVVAVVTPYLDDARLSQYAAGALWEINSDEAMTEIKKRLHDKDYPHAQAVASRLLRMPSRSSRVQTDAESQETERIIALFEDLRDSPHSAVQNSIRSHLASLERRIVDEELREFQSLVTAKNLDNAAEVFEVAVRRCLDGVGDSSSRASRLTVYISTMQRALSRIGESKRAEQLFAATLSTIEAEAEKTGQEELHDVIVDLRGQRLMTMISRGLDVESDEVTQLLSDIKSQLSRKAESGLTSADLSLATRMGRTLEHRDKPELAADIYRTVIEAIHKTDDERLARIVEMLEGSIRRMGLIGNPIELSGITVDGDAFDWDSYRGKVVLIDFWATWCGPCLAEVPNVVKNYQLYHDHGFEVVGISLDRDRQALEKYLDSEKLPWVTLHEQDSEGKHPVAVHYGISAIPTVILVDRDGKVVSLRARGQKLGQLLQQLIGSPFAPRGELTFVDLQPKCNLKLAEKMHFGGPGENNLAELPAGEQTFAEIGFHIGEGLIHLASTIVPDLPEKVTEIEVNQRFKNLYLLQGMGFAERAGFKEGATIGMYLVRYEDETTETIPVVYGEDVRDWWNADRSRPVSRGVVAWEGSNAAAREAGMTLRLYATKWTNPHSQKRVTSIDFISENTTAAAPFCVAMTVEAETEKRAEVGIGDHKQIQGQWILVSNEDGGRPKSNGQDVMITGDKIALTLSNGTVSEVVYQLRSDTMPKHIDLTIRDETWLGIYELNKDTLKICANDTDGGTRSTRFESKPSSDNDLLLVLERVKP